MSEFTNRVLKLIKEREGDVAPHILYADLKEVQFILDTVLERTQEQLQKTVLDEGTPDPVKGQVTLKKDGVAMLLYERRSVRFKTEAYDLFERAGVLRDVVKTYDRKAVGRLVEEGRLESGAVDAVTESSTTKVFRAKRE